MRLINVETMKFEEFWEDRVPPYAILSHAWGKKEVSFQDFQDLTAAANMAGFAKIRGACSQAHKDGLRYLWVDTNCIDKASSAELSEAINSMFRWYHDSQICYVYLEDVGARAATPTLFAASPGGASMSDSDPWLTQFQSSRWFTRGWTLQELLAPTSLDFYSRDWVWLGSKVGDWRNGGLAEAISPVTRIPVAFLTGEVSLDSASIACKMSWLSRRQTTRQEDMAYCMLGLFGINMALLYGEGNKAFVRLQEEILKTSSDHTIFCWTWNETIPPSWTSMLAPYPGVFENSSSYIEHSPRSQKQARPKPYAMTNYGLFIELDIVQCWSYCFLVLHARDRHMMMSTNSAGHGNRVNYWTSIPIRARRNDAGIYTRERFPPEPLMAYHGMYSDSYSVIVRARPDPFSFVSLHAPQYSGTHGFLLSVHDTIPFLNRSSASYRHWAAAGANRNLDEVSKAIPVKAFPKSAFHMETSTFWLNLHLGETSGLMRIGEGWETPACALHFALRSSDSSGVQWHCCCVNPSIKLGSESLRELDMELAESQDDDHGPSRSQFQVSFGTVMGVATSWQLQHIHLRPIFGPVVSGIGIEGHGDDRLGELSDSSMVVRIGVP